MGVGFFGKPDIVEIFLIQIQNYWLKNLDPKVFLIF
jgi:hypothetical protein